MSRTGSMLSVWTGAVALILGGCTMDTLISGGPGTGSETTNGLVLKAVYADSTPAGDVAVFIRARDYLADTASAGISRDPDYYTAPDGLLHIDSLEPGEYLLEINDGRGSATLVDLVAPQRPDTLLDLGNRVLQASSRLLGRVDRSSLQTEATIFVQIYGTDRVTMVDDSGSFEFPDLPAGRYALRICSSTPEHGVVDGDSLVVKSGYVHNAGRYRLPSDYWQDSLIVRMILGRNGRDDISVSEVARFQSGRIAHLDLRHLGLRFLPGEIGLLRVTHLYLDDNLLEALPEQIGSIVTLQYLALTGNLLTRLPDALCNLQNLYYLNCTDNLLEELPGQTGMLKSLDYLWLRNNRLVSLPESIGGLEWLGVLDVSANALQNLPVSIAGLHQISYLSVAHNRLDALAESVQDWIDRYSCEPQWRETQKWFRF